MDSSLISSANQLHEEFDRERSEQENDIEDFDAKRCGIQKLKNESQPDQHYAPLQEVGVSCND